MHPDRFWTYVNEEWDSAIIRSKGMFWIASRPDSALVWSQAGGSLRAEPAGIWWDSMSKLERNQHASFQTNEEYIMSRWDKDYGDRINEIVFIGQDMAKEEILQELDDCLCNDEEYAAYQDGSVKGDVWPIHEFQNEVV